MQKKEPAPRPSLLLGQGAGGEVYASIKVGDRLVVPVCKAWELIQCASLMEVRARPQMRYLCKFFVRFLPSQSVHFCKCCIQTGSVEKVGQSCT